MKKSPHFFALLFILLLSCAKKNITTLPVEDHSWSQLEYESLVQNWNQRYPRIPKIIETVNESSGELDMRVVSRYPEVVSSADIPLLKELFYSSIDIRNEKLNYDVSKEYGELLRRNLKGDAFELDNWLWVLTIRENEVLQKDSLQSKLINQQRSIDDVENKQVKLQSENVKLQEKIQSLSDSLVGQNEVIEKLKKLEMFLEDDRKRFE